MKAQEIVLLIEKSAERIRKLKGRLTYPLNEREVKATEKMITRETIFLKDTFTLYICTVRFDEALRLFKRLDLKEFTEMPERLSYPSFIKKSNRFDSSKPNKSQIPQSAK